MSRYIGYFDGNVNAALTGWIADRDDLSRQIDLIARLNGTVIGSFSCKDFRPDLLAKGIGSGRYGFSFDYSNFHQDLRPSDIDFILSGTNERVKAGESGVVIVEPYASTVSQDHIALSKFAVGQEVKLLLRLDHHDRMIGDSITALPLVYHLSSVTRSTVLLTGAFHPVALQLVSEDVAHYDSAATFAPLALSISVSYARSLAGMRNMHAYEGFFLAAGLFPPRRPHKLAFSSSPSTLPKGIAIAPFTASERSNPNDHTRAWYPERWNAYALRLKTRLNVPIYLLGSSADDLTRYDLNIFTPVLNKSFAELHSLLLSSLLCITVDSALSHLCHLSGISHHILLYPHVHTQNMVATFYGRNVRKTISELSIDDLWDITLRELNPFGTSLSSSQLNPDGR